MFSYFDKYKSGLSEILLNGKGGKLPDKENPEKLAKEIMKFLKIKSPPNKNNI